MVMVSRRVSGRRWPRLSTRSSSQANVKARSFSGGAWFAMPRSMRVARSGTGITRPLISRCWHRVFMNRERFAKHAPQIAFLD